MVDDTAVGSETGVRSVLRSLRVFEAVAVAQPARVGELAASLGLSKSTVQRALRTLGEAGWIVSLDGDVTRWAVAPRMHALLGESQLERDLREVALPHMRDLRDETEETVHLSVPLGDEIVIIERAEGHQELTTRATIGSKYDALDTAAGWAILAAMPAGDAAPYSVRPSKSREVMSISSAVTPTPGAPIAALTVLVPVSRYSDSLGAHLGPQVASTARAISAALRQPPQATG